MKISPTTKGGKVRLLILVALLAVVGYFSNVQVLYYYLRYSPHEGDIVFQSLMKCDVTDAIEGITHSPFSHCGVVIKENGQWVVIEAIMDVRETPLFSWILRGRRGAFAVYRLKPKYEAVIPEFKTHLIEFLGKPYDYDYEMSDTSIYCSELIYKAFKKTNGEEMGKLEKFGDLDWKPYEAFIRSVQGNKVPVDRIMITPKSLSEAPQIEKQQSFGF
ncbi:MAG: YiiX/YebB-like N1pC/P60 family cysteine hydrolase [Chthoniobacterales bacterium]